MAHIFRIFSWNKSLLGVIYVYFSALSRFLGLGLIRRVTVDEALSHHIAFPAYAISRHSKPSSILTSPLKLLASHRLIHSIRLFHLKPPPLPSFPPTRRIHFPFHVHPPSFIPHPYLTPPEAPNVSYHINFLLGLSKYSEYNLLCSTSLPPSFPASWPKYSSPPPLIHFMYHFLIASFPI